MDTASSSDKNTESPNKYVRFRNPFAAPHPDEEPRCGLFGWTPGWLQLFSNMKMFMFCFVGLGIFHGMHGSYAGNVLPSIERRFGVSGTQMGSIRSASDISGILAAIIVGHYGGSGHRPRWIAAGTVCLGLAMLLYASPEFLFPRSTISTVTGGKTGSLPPEEFCLRPNSSVQRANVTCAVGDHGSSNTNTIVIFGIADFLMGLGATMPIILGLPFVDDNVSYKSTPIYFALSFAGRLFGPLMGLGLGAIINGVYFDLTDPPFPNTDPRWISAWYLGFIICGLGSCLFGIVIGCFPAAIPAKKDLQSVSDPETKHNPATHNHHGKLRQKPVNLRDLPRNLKRLLTNPIYMVKLGTMVVEGIALVGYGGFAQQFIQNQFPVTPQIASLLGGVPPIFAGFVGIVIGSTLIGRFQFKPRHVSMMTVVSSVVGAVCYLSVLFMGCDAPTVVGLPSTTEISLTNRTTGLSCDVINNCNCHSVNFSPVCDTLTNITYGSPCFAGCSSAKSVNRTVKYSNCLCATKQNVTGQPAEVISGLCPTGCTYKMFIAYVGVMCITRLLSSIPMAGAIMVQFRIVDVDLKSLASAVGTVVMSALALLPAPIIAGYIIDSACIFWQTMACGSGRGACLLYNVNNFRTKLHVSVAVCMLIGAALDCVITYLMWNISFDRDEPATEPTKKDIPLVHFSSIINRNQPAHSDSTEPIVKDASEGSEETSSSTSTPDTRRQPWSFQGLQQRKSFPIPNN